MSYVKIEGNASGTGTFTIAAPNSNTDRTLTLPDEAGTVLTSAGAIDVDASAPADSVIINQDGIITRPYTPYFMVGLASSQTSVGSNQVINYVYSGATSFNPRNIGGHWDDSTHSFTAPVTGLYTFIASVYDLTASSGVRSISLEVNGTRRTSLTSVQNIDVSSTAETMAGGSIAYYLNANDVVKFRVYTSNTITIDANNYHTWACGYLIG
jgi:hypothetical protein